MKKTDVTRLTLAALFVALGLALPFATLQIPAIGSMLLPMHLPVLLCGFVCGWPYGLAVGFVTPLLRSVLFGMPPLMPTALAMAFELATYGAVAGALYAKLPKSRGNVLASLVGAMLAGRVVWGLVSWALNGLILAKPFTLPMFFAGAFVNAWPGIVVQLIVVPLIVIALEKAGLIPLKGGRSAAA